jgi:hypothetical protein
MNIPGIYSVNLYSHSIYPIQLIPHWSRRLCAYIGQEIGERVVEIDAPLACKSTDVMIMT